MTHKSAMVTIVIPVYNGEAYVASAIDSVLNQDYPDIELIVLDDGSTDNTRNILQQYGNAFYWETHANIGQARTLNKGWTMARGGILSYLSADDLLAPQAVSVSMRYLDDNPNAVMTYADFNIIDPYSNIVRSVRNPTFNYRDMVVTCECFPGPGVFFRKSAFEKIGGWNTEYRQMPDYEYWLRLGLIGDLYHVPEVLASFRMHDESQSFSVGDVRKSDEPIRIIQEYFGRNASLPQAVLDDREEAFSHAYLVSAQLHWRAGRHRESLRKFLISINYFPSILLRRKFYRVVLNMLAHRTIHRILWKMRKQTRRHRFERPKTSG